MPINEALLAAMKAATLIKPNVRKTYRIQRAAEALVAKQTPPNPKCRIEDAAVPMPDGHEVPLRTFTPIAPYGTAFPGADAVGAIVAGASADDAGNITPRGTILFVHGGGWCTGGIDLYAQACAHMAVRLQRRVVAVEYRLAPECRFPVAVEECYEVARRLCRERSSSSASGTDGITLFGDSAGGNIVAAVSLMARDRGEFMPRTQMLLYPVVGNDYNPETSPFESVRTNGTDYILTAQDMDDYIDMYRSSVADLTNPYFAPLTAHDLSNQPRTLVLSAEYCPLRDEDEAYARRLQLVNDNVSCYRIHDGIHGYLLNTSAVGLVATTYRIIEHFLDGTPLEPAPGTSTTANAPEGGDAWQDVLGTD